MPSNVTRHPASMGWPWQVARWTRAVPGPVGMSFLAIVPMLLFVPLTRTGLFASWREGTTIVLSIGVIALAIVIGRDTAMRQPTDLWIYQKGLSLADWAMGRWLLDAAFALTVMLAWLGAWAIGASVYREPISAQALLATSSWMASLYLMTTALLFAVGALGSQRGTEVCVLFMMIAAIEPLLTRVMPDVVALLVRAILPPVLPAANARILISTGESVRAVLPALLHVGTYAAGLLGFGAWLLGRRRPEETT